MLDFKPYVILSCSFQEAWLKATIFLLNNKCSVYNLIVHISNISAFDTRFHSLYERFCRDSDIIMPKDVMYTIFPENLAKGKDANTLFNQYNRNNGFFDRIKTRWGTYFRRMTLYKTEKESINQLGMIINALRTRKKLYKAAYTIIIQKPGTENIQTMGSPCLNYIALQVEPGNEKTIGLLAVYRNHDFLKRAYGNYMGLSKLLAFICQETGFNKGPITCLSSHAYISSNITNLRLFVEKMSCN